MSREELQAKCFLDRIYMGHFCFRGDFRTGSADTHYELNHHLNSGAEFIAVMCHRGWAKSTILCYIDPMHQIAFSPAGDTRYLVILSETQGQSINHLSRISRALRSNERYRWLFGDKFTSNKKWGAKEIITNNEVRVMALGTGQRVRGTIDAGGRRPTRTYLDDWESHKNASTAKQRRENLIWLYSDVIPFRDQVIGQIVALQSPIAYDCGIFKLMQDPNWVHLYVPLYTGEFGTGEIAWGSMWNWDKISAELGMYKQQGLSGVFDQEYMLIPYKGEGVGVTRDEMRWFEGEYVTGPMGINYIKDMREVDEVGKRLTEPKDLVVLAFSACDPAIGVDRVHDWTANVAIAMDRDSNLYVIAVNRFRRSSSFYIGNTFAEFAWDHRSAGIGIETNGFQSAIGEVADQWCEENKVTFDSVRWFNQRSKKDLRLNWLVNKFKARKIFIRPQDHALVNEVLDWPGGAHDDIMDAMWMAAKIAYAPGYSDPEEAEREGYGAIDRIFDAIPSHKVIV